jgi:hypothetical protein
MGNTFLKVLPTQIIALLDIFDCVAVGDNHTKYQVPVPSAQADRMVLA